MQPKQWPKRLLYVRESTSPLLHMSLLRSYLYTGKPEDALIRSSVIEEKRVHPHLTIQKLQAPHPLFYKKTRKGYINYGLFATDTIKANIALGEYAGELFLMSSDVPTQAHHFNIPSSEYSWSIRLDHLLLTIDCHRIGNELAFVNDYRGINLKPNVKMKPIIHQGFKYYGYVTLREIQKGEEILVDYTPGKTTSSL